MWSTFGAHDLDWSRKGQIKNVREHMSGLRFPFQMTTRRIDYLGNTLCH